MKAPILVTAAIIKNDDGFLICQRKDGDSYGGFWEFPGGKVEYGESPEECLVREIKEELDIGVGVDGLFDVSSYVYPEGNHIVLVVYHCSIISGEIKSNEHSQIRWIKPSEFGKYQFLEADMPLVEKLSVEVN